MSPLKVECDRNLALGEPAKLKLEVHSFSICCEIIPRKYRLKTTWGRDVAWYLHAGDSLTKQPSWSEFLTNQKPYQDQSIHLSSVWNFCVRSSGVLSRESVDVLVKCRLFSQAALAKNYVWLKLKLAQDHARARRRRRDWGEVSELPSLASTPWSVRCLSSLVTVRRIFKTISRPFAELWKTRRSALILG